MFTGILLKTLSTLAFTAMALGVRAAAQEKLPVAEIVLFRSAIALLVLFAWLAARRALSGALATKEPLGHLGRGLTGVVGMFANFTALALLPLADATAYFYAYPIFVTLIAGFFLRESVHVSRWLAVLIGFAGVLVMLSEHLGVSGGLDDGARRGAGVALFGALCAALSIVQTRRLARNESTGAIVFYFTCLCTLFGGLVLALASFVPALSAQAFVAPEGRGWAGLIAAGAAGGVAQILATSSYRYADASLLAAFDYLAMVWALLASLAVEGQAPSLPVLIGAGAISGAGLLALGERRFQKPQKFVIPNKIV
jgi:drug/metabolite transporter (DMT)-like permease